MRVNADRDVCIGAGHCVLSAPNVFDQGDDGVVIVRDHQPPAELEAAVVEAADLCPSRAIIIEMALRT